LKPVVTQGSVYTESTALWMLAFPAARYHDAGAVVLPLFDSMGIENRAWEHKPFSSHSSRTEAIVSYAIHVTVMVV
jgi:hypothetical protein